MWDYRDTPKRRAALAALTPDERSRLTWDAAVGYLRKDTVAMAVWSGMRKRGDGSPFECVCVANGFRDLIDRVVA